MRIAFGLQALLQARGLDLPVIEYLADPPGVDELAAICTALGKRPLELIRRKEALFAELGLSVTDERSDADWLQLMVANPKLIERPIVVYRGRAALGRPPEDVLTLFG